MAGKKFNRFWNSLILKRQEQAACAASINHKNGLSSHARILWGSFELQPISECNHDTAIDQSSLKVEKSLRSISADINRDEISISDHGISRILKGIDLYFIKNYLKLPYRQLGIMTIKGFMEKFYWEKDALELPKKLYIRPIISHFYNI